jgi:hypothetical protein
MALSVLLRLEVAQDAGRIAQGNLNVRLAADVLSFSRAWPLLAGQSDSIEKILHSQRFAAQLDVSQCMASPESGQL